MRKQITAIQMQESATLKAGHGSANGTWRLKSRKSITCPCSKRSVRFPTIPARSSARETSRSGSWERRRRSSVATRRSAIQERTMKNVLLFLNDPKAAPVFVTFTRLKNRVRPVGVSGCTLRKKNLFVFEPGRKSGRDIKKINLRGSFLFHIPATTAAQRSHNS